MQNITQTPISEVRNLFGTHWRIERFPHLSDIQDPVIVEEIGPYEPALSNVYASCQDARDVLELQIESLLSEVTQSQLTLSKTAWSRWFNRDKIAELTKISESIESLEFRIRPCPDTLAMRPLLGMDQTIYEVRWDRINNGEVPRIIPHTIRQMRCYSNRGTISSNPEVDKLDLLVRYTATGFSFSLDELSADFDGITLSEEWCSVLVSTEAAAEELRIAKTKEFIEKLQKAL